MAHFSNLMLILAMFLSSVWSSPSPRLSSPSSSSEVFCPAFPGYCSESRPGDTCLVVCAFGRNNVPECQADGTWTDAPRCIEHEPGLPQQRPNQCPGIPGYCSLDVPGALCEFQCATGPSIRSFCTPDGTWDPYPTCQGDIRETKDGCNPCPGPFGGPRNRAVEQRRGQQQQQRGRNQQRGQQVGRAQQQRRGQQQQQQQQQQRRGQQQGGHRRNNYRNGNNNNNSGRYMNNGNNNRRSSNRQGNNRQGNKNFGRPEQPRSGGGRSSGFNRASNNLQKALKNTQQCPGQSLEACIDVCPSSSARIFGACVSGCARRCGVSKK